MFFAFILVLVHPRTLKKLTTDTLTGTRKMDKAKDLSSLLSVVS
jgi:hypothetical protein